VPLPDAFVRLDLHDDSAVVAPTDASGVYELEIPRVPDFFAISASREGYVPTTANMSAATVAGSILSVDIRLRPINIGVVAVESVPDVHHLGNDRFTGAINSRFQKRSEGRVFNASFELSSDQAPPYVSACRITLLAKGVQCPHRLWINNVLIDERLSESPADGSFGEFTAGFDVNLLRPGTNTLQIEAVRCRGDLDDFEFVNVRIIIQEVDADI